jgi:hypothetical protein
MLGERIKLQVDEEVAAGRACLARGRPIDFQSEQEAGRDREARAAARLELEQAAGKSASVRSVLGFG